MTQYTFKYFCRENIKENLWVNFYKYKRDIKTDIEGWVFYVPFFDVHMF